MQDLSKTLVASQDVLSPFILSSNDEREGPYCTQENKDRTMRPCPVQDDKQDQLPMWLNGSSERAKKQENYHRKPMQLASLVSRYTLISCFGNMHHAKEQNTTPS